MQRRQKSMDKRKEIAKRSSGLLRSRAKVRPAGSAGDLETGEIANVEPATTAGANRRRKASGPNTMNRLTAMVALSDWVRDLPVSAFRVFLVFRASQCYPHLRLQVLGYPVYRDPVDDHTTPVSPENYIRWRLLPMMDFYQKRIPSYVSGRTVSCVSMLVAADCLEAKCVPTDQFQLLWWCRYLP